MLWLAADVVRHAKVDAKEVVVDVRVIATVIVLAVAKLIAGDVKILAVEAVQGGAVGPVVRVAVDAADLAKILAVAVVGHVPVGVRTAAQAVVAVAVVQGYVAQAAIMPVPALAMVVPVVGGAMGPAPGAVAVILPVRGVAVQGVRRIVQVHVARGVTASALGLQGQYKTIGG